MIHQNKMAHSLTFCISLLVEVASVVGTLAAELDPKSPAIWLMIFPAGSVASKGCVSFAEGLYKR